MEIIMNKVDYTRRKLWLSMAITVVIAMIAGTSLASPNPSGGPMPYARLAADWWQWVLETPTADNPLLDTTGQFCEVNQKGKYWFLAGTLGSGVANRICTIPSGKSLFFPVVNLVYGAYLTDPPGTKRIGYMRSLISSIADCTNVSATLDGAPVTIVHERSIPFVLHLPEDNLFGATRDQVKNLMVSPSVDEGDYVLLNPLSPGNHTVVFENTPVPNCTFPLKVTYSLYIEP
jgi:hypothetical protein